MARRSFYRGLAPSARPAESGTTTLPLIESGVLEATILNVIISLTPTLCQSLMTPHDAQSIAMRREHICILAELVYLR